MNSMGDGKATYSEARMTQWEEAAAGLHLITLLTPDMELHTSLNYHSHLEQ